ncbi:carbon catabolit repression protein [Streptomyces glaucosporus]|uniref:Carbon catabolit repression protein n=1 Tax=Streptomyces glaucosporus TaxID=284044 RepID=A0ABN3ISF4_9ACTN
MSDATERPADADPDAWAAACEEDLAAERERRRERYGTPPGSAAEELRRLAEAVAGKLAELGGPAARGVFHQVVSQARAVVEPVVERNPKVFDHLAAAGGELLAAYRAAVEDQERRWTRGAADRDAAPGGAPGEGASRSTPDGPGSDEADGAGGHGKHRKGRDEDGGEDGGEAGPAGSERIDLD